MGKTLSKTSNGIKSRNSNNLKIELIEEDTTKFKKLKTFGYFEEIESPENNQVNDITDLSIKIIGKSGRGKTALINRFILKKFQENHFSTYNTVSSRTLWIRGNPLYP